MVSRRMPVSRSIRRSDHPSRPNAMTCCFFSSLKTLLTVTEDSVLTSAFNALDDGLQLAGFQVTLTGRFWVTPEAAVTALGESSVSDLKTRPDYAVTVHNALVGFVELKAPGKGADPRKFKDPHDKAQWDLPMGNPGTGTASESYGRASRDTVRWPSRLPMSTGPASSQYDMGSVPSTGNGSFRTIASSIVRTRSFGNHA